MAIKIDAARLLMHKAALKKDRGEDFVKDAAMAKVGQNIFNLYVLCSIILKVFSSEAATWVAHQSIQTLGGMG